MTRKAVLLGPIQALFGESLANNPLVAFTNTFRAKGVTSVRWPAVNDVTGNINNCEVCHSAIYCFKTNKTIVQTVSVHISLLYKCVELVICSCVGVS